jgi:hypothetical protein
MWINAQETLERRRCKILRDWGYRNPCAAVPNAGSDPFPTSVFADQVLRLAQFGLQLAYAVVQDAILDIGSIKEGFVAFLGSKGQ